MKRLLKDINGGTVKKLTLVLTLVFLPTLFGTITKAQRLYNITNDTAATASAAARSPVVDALPNLPDADLLIYFNTQRILDEALPKFLPAEEVAKMRQQFSDIKQFVGLDPSQVDYLMLAIRFRKPSSDLSFVPPEYMLVAGGDLDANSLITFARTVAGESLRDEAHGGKSLSLFRIDPIAKEAEKNAFLATFAEVAVVPLTDSSIAIGTTAYIKAAVDAGEGKGRISAEALSSLLRDHEALISIAGSPLNSFSRSFGLQGVEGSERDERCVTHFGDFYAGVTMNASDFRLRGVLNADNADTAKIINSLFTGLLKQAMTSAPDKSAQKMLDNLVLSAENHEVLLQADVSQQAVVEFIREQMKPKQAEAKPSEKPASRRPARRRTPRRR